MAKKLKKKWSSEMTISFLEGYESYPCLWNVHSDSYKNRDDRENAYKGLSELMGIKDFDTANVKAKIRSIRNAYALEIAKIWKTKRSGADKIYKPKVPWFPIAHRILHQVVQTRPNQSSLKMETETETQSDSEEYGHFMSSLSSNNAVAHTKQTPERLTINIDVTPSRAIKRTKALEELQGITRTLEKEPVKEEENEFDCFGKTVACQLKKLPESVALESIAYIQTYLVKQRLKSNSGKKADQHLSPAASPASSMSSYEYAAISDAIS